MAVTIQDVAQVAKVSKAAVSAVINDKPGVSDKTREMVLEVIRKLNYRPSRLARSLSVKETRTIGLVIKEIDNPFYSKMMKGIYDTCWDLGYTVLLGSSELSYEKERNCIETLMSQRVDGIILSPLQFEDGDLSYLYDLKKADISLVTIGAIKNVQSCVVEIDNIMAAYEAVNYLINLGHERIAIFKGPRHSPCREERLAGYLKAMNENGLRVGEELNVEAGSYIRDGYRAAKKLFSSSDHKPTAIFCYNDLVAIGLMNSLMEMGTEIPEDVSVVGFDDIDISASLSVPLTTVHGSGYDIGKTAAEVLIHQLNDEEQVKKRFVVEHHLVERKSTVKRKDLSFDKKV